MNCIQTLNQAGKICLEKADKAIERENFEAADALQECAKMFFEQAELLDAEISGNYYEAIALAELEGR